MPTSITLEQINTFNVAYAFSIDDDQLESWPFFFVEDCFYKVTTVENQLQGLPAGLIYADSRWMLQDRVTALRDANIFERHRYRHIVGTALIAARNGQGIDCETPFQITRIMRGGKPELFTTGKYVDHFVVQEKDVLKLAKRIVVCDSVSFDTLLALPL